MDRSPIHLAVSRLNKNTDFAIVMLIRCLMTVIRNNSSAARRHAVREAGEQFLVERLPLLDLVLLDPTTNTHTVTMYYGWERSV